MDEHTATQMAAVQMIDSLGAPAGFMIAIRLIQVIAERTSPKTPELIDAFASCLKGMERFAEAASLDRIAQEESSEPEKSDDGSAGSAGHGHHGANGSSNGSGDGKGGRGGPLA